MGAKCVEQKCFWVTLGIGFGQVWVINLYTYGFWADLGYCGTLLLLGNFWFRSTFGFGQLWVDFGNFDLSWVPFG